MNNTKIVAQRVSGPMMPKTELIRGIKRTMSKKGTVVAVLDLTDYMAIPSWADRSMIEELTGKTIVNISSIEDDIIEANNKNERAVYLMFMYQDTASKTTYVVKTGYVDCISPPICFKVASLPTRIADSNNIGSNLQDISEPCPQIPLPRNLPHRNKIDAETTRSGQVGFSRIMELIYTLTDLFNPDSGILPHGEDWWDWAVDEVGKVSDDEDVCATYILILWASVYKTRRDFVKMIFGGILERCINADPTYLRRLKREFPEYGLCQDAFMIKNMVNQEIEAISEIYRAEFFSPQSPFAFSIPKFVTNCMNIIHSIYAESEE